MYPKPITLALLDKQLLFTEILKSFLLEHREINKIIHSTEVHELLLKLRHTTVDILIFDPRMQDVHPNSIMRLVQKEHPDIKILMLSENVRNFAADQQVEHNIYGYISKSDSVHELLDAILTISSERIYRNGHFTEMLYYRQQHNKNLISLNEREIKLLILLWEEKSNKEIADQLFVGIRSVEKLRQNIKEKIGVTSTVGLLKYAIKQGLLSL
ncbi:DNA-binding NarL/FixJ family response regulator [Chitinophaga sp. W3I9]|uniref:response regulator transcription factor n=1 Tax=unclassified Chitinophaga TaxID=2619133 RepID=UPI003D19752E